MIEVRRIGWAWSSGIFALLPHLTVLANVAFRWKFKAWPRPPAMNTR
jgi:ABC-type proline/glycine betaine transport system ATPase subunit